MMSRGTRAVKFFGLVLMMFDCSQAWARSADQSSLQSALTSLVKQVELGAVESVDILYVPTSAMFSVGFTSEKLKRDYWYRVSIPAFGLSHEQQQLVVDLKRTSIEPSRVPGDIRWGLIFRIRGTKPRELFLDQFAHLGEIDGVRVAIQGGICEWLIRKTATLGR